MVTCTCTHFVTCTYTFCQDICLIEGDTMNLLYGELSKWKSFRNYAFAISLFLALGSPVNAATMSSPDGQIILTIETTTDESNPPTPHLVYQVSFRGKVLVEPSALRLDLEGQPP